MPSELVMPTRFPVRPSRCAISRTVVVLPLVPATATSGMRPSSSPANMVEMIASPTGAALAERRLQVHPQAGRGIHLDHPAALAFQGAEHALANHVDATQVEADHLGRGHGTGREFLMDVVGDVGGGAAGAQVGVVAQDHPHALARHRIGIKSLLGQRGQRDGVEPDLGQHGGVALAAPGVPVDLDHQLANGVLAITDHVRRVAAGRRDQPVADHQQPVIAAAANTARPSPAELTRARGVVGGHDPLAGLDVGRHSPALVAVARLHHHRAADLAGRGPRVLGVLDRAALGHRHPGRF